MDNGLKVAIAVVSFYALQAVAVGVWMMILVLRTSHTPASSAFGAQALNPPPPIEADADDEELLAA